MRQWIGPLLAPVVGVGMVLLLLAVIGRETRQLIRPLERYSVAFADIDCTAPPGMDRANFLSEVQYLANWPGHFQLLDDEVTARLAEAFAGHPWVERVERVALEPPRRVAVKLLFRVPVLVLKAPLSEPERHQSKEGLVERTVDGQGILLPRQAPTKGLPRLHFEAAPPAGPAGTRWGDPRVEAAAGALGLLRPYQKRLHLERVTLTSQGLVLQTTAFSRVLWGRVPHAEGEEAAASQKVQRLLDYCSRHGDLDHPEGPYEHDVRPLSGPIHRSVRSPRPDRSADR